MNFLYFELDIIGRKLFGEAADKGFIALSEMRVIFIDW